MPDFVRILLRKSEAALTEIEGSTRVTLPLEASPRICFTPSEGWFKTANRL